MGNDLLSSWNIERAADLYGIRNWGAGYFGINEKGHVTVRPHGNGSPHTIDVYDIIRGVQARGIAMPTLLRFTDILASRVRAINTSFERAIREVGYRGAYRGVYPIKVNQQQQVVEEIVRYGAPYHHGLEAGSKAELIAALAYVSDPEAFIICNGYKDEEFVDLALLSRKMGTRTIIVLEMATELPMVLARAERLGVKAEFGVRAKLSTRAEGYWVESGGDRSMFGLNASQIIDVVDHLREVGQLDGLRLLHYHVGSQIPNIRGIRRAATEAIRLYVDLAREGAAMGYLDVGGGLAVDYDGSHTNFASSSNYALDEYAADIVEAVMSHTDESGVEHPTLLSESGRATTAHHSLLVFDVLNVSRFESHGPPTSLAEDTPEPLKLLMETALSITGKNAQESYHDVVHYRDEARALYEAGRMSLRERALGERIFWHAIQRIANETQQRKYVPDELEGLRTVTADVYYGNFSVFQSLPDVWAIQQLFPVMPIHRLTEEPTRQATLADITCDCDGKIDRFIDLHDVKHTLPLHPLGEEDYYLGVFLVGAYQETLGDLHNLLGDTNIVSLRVDDQGELHYDREILGDTVADVLSYVEYSPADMINRVRMQAERAVREGRMSAQDRRDIMDGYAAGMRGYTYFER